MRRHFTVSREHCDHAKAPIIAEPDVPSYPAATGPRFTSRPKPRLFALVIGIGKYAFKEFSDLPGAVPDAKEVVKWLVTDLQVPRNQISLITNEAASRTGIISALKAFRSDDRIRHGDPIFIYYAGHGSGIPPPENWESGGPGKNIQILVPQDYAPERGIRGIPDHVLGWLIDKVAEEKGNNITVVLDCCHSGSGTRSDPLTRIRWVQLEPSMALLDRESQPRPVSLESHVLIAACGESELAREVGGRGAFTTEVLKLFRRIPIDSMTYSDIPTYIKMPGQNPQVEGANQHRYIFDLKMPSPSPARPSYLARYHSDSGLVLLNAGTAHGVTLGAEFALYPTHGPHPSGKPYLTFIVDNSASFFSTLKPANGPPIHSIPTEFRVFRAKLGKGGTIRLYLSADHNSDGLIRDIWHLLQNVELVNSPDDAHLELTVRDNQVVVSVRDRKATVYGFVHKFPALQNRQNLALFLEKAGHFYRERDRHTSIDAEVAKMVTLNFFKLGAHRSRFEDIPESQLGQAGPNLYSANTINFVVEEGCVYGIKLINSSSYDLYPTVLYLDNSNLSITTYYEPPFNGSNNLEAPLKRNGGTLTIGYGSGGMLPFSYTVPGTFNIGFLKLLVSTRPIHSTAGEWPCPCHLEAHGPHTLDKGEFLGTLTIPMIQRRSQAPPFNHTVSTTPFQPFTSTIHGTYPKRGWTR